MESCKFVGKSIDKQTFINVAMGKKFRNITFDKIEIDDKIVKNIFLYPKSNVVFDEKGNDIGRYSVKKGELEAFVEL